VITEATIKTEVVGGNGKLLVCAEVAGVGSVVEGGGGVGSVVAEFVAETVEVAAEVAAEVVDATTTTTTTTTTANTEIVTSSSNAKRKRKPRNHHHHHRKNLSSNPFALPSTTRTVLDSCQLSKEHNILLYV
jgi:hypothetical protein